MKYTPKPLTRQQQKALHVYYTNLGKALNDAGIPQQKVLKELVDFDWNPKSVKELWRQFQVILLGKESTTELDKLEDITLIYEHLNRFMGEKFGLHVPFPHDEEVAVFKDKKYK